MPETEIERSRDPAQLPVYKHLSSMLVLIGGGVLAFRHAESGLGVLALLAAAVFLVLAVRSVLVRRRV